MTGLPLLIAALRAAVHSAAPAEALAAVSAPPEAQAIVNSSLRLPAGHYAIVDCRRGLSVEAPARCEIVVFNASDASESAPAPIPAALSATREELFQTLVDLSGETMARETSGHVLALYLAAFAGAEQIDRLPSRHFNGDLAARAEAVMRRSIGRRLSLTDLAGSLGCSRPHLSTVFKKTTGHSPIDHFNRLKIQRALTLLRTTDMKIAEVSVAVGIADPFYFSRLFKKITGHSPQSLR